MRAITKDMTITETIFEVCNEICRDYCKYLKESEKAIEETGYLPEVCEKCPLNRLR